MRVSLEAFNFNKKATTARKVYKSQNIDPPTPTAHMTHEQSGLAPHSRSNTGEQCVTCLGSRDDPLTSPSQLYCDLKRQVMQ